MQDEITVDVCIASYNTKRSTELTVRSALRRAGVPFHLLVGDGASTDGSLEMLQSFADAGLLELEQTSSPRKHAEWLDHWYSCRSNRYLVFSDSDVYYRRSGWLLQLVEACERTGAALVAGRIQTHWSERPAFASGSQKRLPGARPEPCLLLLDMTQLRGVVNASFAWHQEPIPDRPGQKLFFDVAGVFMRAVEQAGLQCIEMPADFQRSYRHWGGLTARNPTSHWALPSNFRLRARQAAKAGLVSILLAAERALDVAARG